MDEFIVGVFTIVDVIIDFSVIVVFSVDVVGFKVDWDISGFTVVVLSFIVLLLIGVTVIVEIFVTIVTESTVSLVLLVVVLTAVVEFEEFVVGTVLLTTGIVCWLVGLLVSPSVVLAV